MPTPDDIPQTNFLRPGELCRGPDIFRPGTAGWLGDTTAKTFIYTKYTDQTGNRWFCEPCPVGHESRSHPRCCISDGASHPHETWPRCGSCRAIEDFSRVFWEKK
jgi:hypothetical protein